MRSAVAVAGTWGEDPGKTDWWRPNSAWWARAGLQPVDPSDPFEWSTLLDGVVGPNLVWSTAGRALGWYLWAKARALSAPPVIAHSHGGQVAAYAAAQGMSLGLVVTVATPVRTDLDDAYAALAKHAKRWVHIYTDEVEGTPWQRLGQLGMATLGQHAGRAMPRANQNVYLPGLTHGGLVDAVEQWRWVLE